MAVAVVDHIQALTVEDLQAEVRRLGVPATADIPRTLPPETEAQWALLAPYVGQPLKAIPPALLLLFKTKGLKMNGRVLSGLVRTLPPAQRMVSATRDEDLFI